MNQFASRPGITPPLDEQFTPAILANRAFREAVKRARKPVPVQVALERADGSVSRHATEVLPDGHPAAETNFVFIERLLKFLLWSRGGCKIHFAGPAALFRKIEQHYQQSPTGRFDAAIMGG